MPCQKDVRIGELALLAVEHARLKALAAIINDGYGVNAMPDHKATLLTFAVKEEQPGVVDFLLRAGADVNLAGKKGCPLGSAVRHKNLELTKKLLRHGADMFLSYDPLSGDRTTTPVYQAYRYCWPCFLLMIESGYGRKKVTRKESEAFLSAIDEHVFSILEKAFENRSKLLIRIISPEIRAHKEALREDHHFGITVITRQFTIDYLEDQNRRFDTDFFWQEYVFDTLPFIDESFIRKESRYFNDDNYLHSGLQALVEDRKHFVENLIKAAIRRPDEEKALHLLSVAFKERRALPLPSLLKLAREKDMKKAAKLMEEHLGRHAFL